jgi:hypothetical protein
VALCSIARVLALQDGIRIAITPEFVPAPPRAGTPSRTH